MHLMRLECRNFRSLEACVFEPAPGVNVLRGDNAQGKTTVLEALLFAATTKSHRTNTERDLLRFEAGDFHVTAQVRRRDRDVTLEAHWWKGTKRFKVNGVAQPRLSGILGRIHVVLFSPEEVALVKSGAAARRRFLDMELSQIHPPYLAALQQFRQALRQRNELLRGRRPDPGLISVWDEQLARHGTVVMDARAAFIAELSVLAAEAYARIAGAEPLSLIYRPDVRSPATLLETLEKGRDGDVRRQATCRGPQLDDMDILIADRPARSHGSQGQQKTAALAIKLAELALVHARIGEYPILMLDEVLAELDAGRARRLFDTIGPEVQCLVTTTERTPEAGRFGTEAANFLLENGRLGPLPAR